MNKRNYKIGECHCHCRFRNSRCCLRLHNRCFMPDLRRSASRHRHWSCCRCARYCFCVSWRNWCWLSICRCCRSSSRRFVMFTINFTRFCSTCLVLLLLLSCCGWRCSDCVCVCCSLMELSWLQIFCYMSWRKKILKMHIIKGFSAN